MPSTFSKMQETQTYLALARLSNTTKEKLCKIVMLSLMYKSGKNYFQSIKRLWLTKCMIMIVNILERRLITKHK